MPCVIRKVAGDRFESFIELLSDEWRLREQIEALEAWLREHPRALDPEHSWVADVGFCVREDARGGGPPISRDLMRMCLDANVEIWLSEYTGSA